MNLINFHVNHFFCIAKRVLQTNLANKTVGVYKSLGAIKMEIKGKGKNIVKPFIAT